MKKKKLIKYVIDTKKINFDDNIILAAFNLAFIGFFFQKKIKHHKNLIVWPDGILSKRFMNCIKIPGNELIKNLILNKKIRKIIILGNSSYKDIKLLKYLYEIEVKNYSLKFDTAENLFNDLPKIYKNYLYVITLPTPKQEQIAYLIAKNYKFFKIICIGGGLSIASGNEKKCPKILYKIGLEFLWRLKGNTARRIQRLILTFVLYLISELTFFYRKVKFININKFI